MNTFFSPKTLRELLPLLAQRSENTYLLAGGTDLMIHFKKEKRFDYSIIDLSCIQELRHIEDRETSVLIGAAVTMTELENHPLIQTSFPDLVKAASMVGSPIIRNRGTLGGNAANASHCADTTPILFCHNATAHIVDSKGKTSTKTMEELIIGSGKITLDFDEILTHLEIPKDKDFYGFSKLGSRKAVTISKLNCCMKLSLDQDVIQKAKIYLGAIGIRPICATIVADTLIGQSVHKVDFASLIEAAKAQVEAAIPTRDSKYYKRIALTGVLEDALHEVRRSLC